MKKKDIRHYYKEKRCQLSTAQITKLDDLLLIQFQKLAIHIPSVIMTYAPLSKFKEFDPQTITDFCYFKNPNQYLVYPVLVNVDGAPELVSIMVNDETIFEKNSYGIDEPVNGEDISPEQIDMVIVPLLGFDKKGYRVGYGRGFYDKFLKLCRKDCIKVGFSYFDPVDAIEDVCDLDVRLDYCVTHEKLYSF